MNAKRLMIQSPVRQLIFKDFFKTSKYIELCFMLNLTSKNFTLLRLKLKYLVSLELNFYWSPSTLNMSKYIFSSKYFPLWAMSRCRSSTKVHLAYPLHFMKMERSFRLNNFFIDTKNSFEKCQLKIQ